MKPCGVLAAFLVAIHVATAGKISEDSEDLVGASFELQRFGRVVRTPLGLGLGPLDFEVYWMEELASDHSCRIAVTSDDMQSMRERHFAFGAQYVDEWKFTSGPADSLYNDICMNECNQRCRNDEFNGITITKAEKGTIIQLFDDSSLTNDDDYVTIEILEPVYGQDIVHSLPISPFIPERKKTYPFLRIFGLEAIDVDHNNNSRQAKYYKMTFHRKNGSLNRKVSGVKVHFPHRD